RCTGGWGRLRPLRERRGYGAACGPFGREGASGVLVDVHHVAEELDRVGALPLEGVAAHDRAERAAGRELAHLFQDVFGALRLAAGEDDDALAVEAALDDEAHAVGHR